MVQEDEDLSNFEDDKFYLKEYQNKCSLCGKKLFLFKKKIGLYNYCSSCKDFILGSYEDIKKSLLYKFYFIYWSKFSHSKNESIILSNYSEDKGFNKEFLKNISIKIEKDTIKIKFKNYQVKYSPDNRLTLENQMINKRQHFNSSVFWDFHTILLSLESLPLWFYNSYGRSFSPDYRSNPYPKIDPALSKYKKLIVEYEDIGMNVKGEDVPVKIAEIKVNIEKLKSKNIPNILEKNRWDLFLKLIDFNFNKFPTGADGFRGYQGDIEDYNKRQSIGIDIGADFLEMECPICSSERKVNIKDLPNKGKSLDWECEDCGQTTQLSLPDESYRCPFCKKDFSSLSSKMKHIKLCGERLKNLVKCNGCKIELSLDEKERKELDKKEIVEIICPKCESKFKVKRKGNKLIKL